MKKPGTAFRLSMHIECLDEKLQTSIEGLLPSKDVLYPISATYPQESRVVQLYIVGIVNSNPEFERQWTDMNK